MGLHALLDINIYHKITVLNMVYYKTGSDTGNQRAEKSSSYYRGTK